MNQQQWGGGIVLHMQMELHMLAGRLQDQVPNGPHTGTFGIECQVVATIISMEIKQNWALLVFGNHREYQGFRLD